MIGLLVVAGSCSSEHEPEATPSDVSSTGNREGISLELEVPNQQVPLGEPVPLGINLINPTARSESVSVRIALHDPAGRDVDAVQTTVFVPHDERVESVVDVTPAQWSAELGTYRFSGIVELGDTQIASAKADVEVGEPTVTIPRFADVTDAWGLTSSVPAAECGQFSNGAAFGDIDGDGDLDLVLTRLSEPVQLFVNEAGRFTDESAARKVNVSGANGAAFADYDNDGDRDLVVVTDAADRLFANDGDGVFTDVSEVAGIGVDDTERGMDAAWGDYDNDGFVDLYVTNYMTCTGEWDTEQQIIANVDYDLDVLYHNRGDGSFEVATDLLSGGEGQQDEGGTIGAGFGAAWFDYDDDGLLDLYLANDFVGPTPDSNRLWHNDGATPGGGWAFTDVSLKSGTAFYMNTMGIGVADIDRDGDLDMALSNVGASKLVRNSGDGTFVDDTTSGIGRPTPEAGYLSITWGTLFGDLNLDGWDDLFQTAGNFMQPPDVPIGVQPDVVYVSDATGERWLDVSAATGAADPGDTKGLALVDVDGDGLLDVFAVNQDGSPRLYRNVTDTTGHWLGLHLVGSISNRDGCGAVVRADTDAGTITRLVQCGSGGGGSGSQPVVHVGLGASQLERLTITWPSGSEQVVEHPAIDRYSTVTEESTS